MCCCRRLSERAEATKTFSLLERNQAAPAPARAARQRAPGPYGSHSVDKTEGDEDGRSETQQHQHGQTGKRKETDPHGGAKETGLFTACRRNEVQAMCHDRHAQNAKPRIRGRWQPHETNEYIRSSQDERASDDQVDAKHVYAPRGWRHGSPLSWWGVCERIAFTCSHSIGRIPTRPKRHVLRVNRMAPR